MIGMRALIGGQRLLNCCNYITIVWLKQINSKYK